VHALIERGDAAAAREAAARRTELAEALRQPNYLWTVVTYDAMTAATEGRLDEAEELTQAAFTMRRRTDELSAGTVYVAQMHQIRWLQGRMDELIELDEGLEARWPGRATWAGALAWARAESGDLGGAASHVEAVAARGFASIPRNLEWLPTVGALSFACSCLRDAERAAELYALLLPYRDRNCAAGQSAFYGAVSHHLGLLARTLGRREEARLHFSHALRRHDEFRSPPLIAKTTSELANVG
jgi:tetratricopeptide (TPR) repeat protein